MRRFIMLGDCEMHEVRPSDEEWITDKTDVYMLENDIIDVLNAWLDALDTTNDNDD